MATSRSSSEPPRIVWGPVQQEKIEGVHEVSEEDFRQAWLNRDTADDEVRPNGSTEGFGATDAGRYLVLAWADQNDGAIFPLTAFSPRGLRQTGDETEEEEEHEHQRTLEREPQKQKHRRKRKKRGGS